MAEGKKPRGFAAMDPKRVKEISAMGGKEAHAKGTAHRYTKEEASAAGKKGGQSLAQNKEHMAEIGRKGGAARAAKLKAKKEAEKALADEVAAELERGG